MKIRYNIILVMTAVLMSSFGVSGVAVAAVQRERGGQNSGVKDYRSVLLERKMVGVGDAVSGISSSSGDVLSGGLGHNSGAYKGVIDVAQESLMQKDSLVSLNLMVSLRNVKMSGHQAVVLVPVIVGQGQRLELPELVLNSGMKQKLYQRSLQINREMMARGLRGKDARAWARVRYQKPYRVMRIGEQPLERVPYNYSFRFEPWMMGAKLEIMERVLGSANDVKSVYASVLVPSLSLRDPANPYDFHSFQVNFIQPVVEVVKRRSESGSANLDFRIGSYEIDRNFKNNASQLTDINATLARVTGNPNATVNKISIVGYASPDGSYQVNQRLAMVRAESLQGYIKSFNSFPTSVYSVDWVAEDWAGLKSMVEGSGLPSADRNLVVDIINNDESPVDKQMMMMDLPGGLYRYLYDNFYPRLRRVEYKVEYDIQTFDLEQAKALVFVDPTQLSLSEIFAVAGSYEVGSDQWVTCFDIAAQLFPTDVTACVNAAGAAIVAGDATRARLYLQGLDAEAAAANNMGVLCLMEGNLEMAERMFTRAINNDISQAKENLIKIKTSN